MESGKFGSATDEKSKYIREDKLTMCQIKVMVPKRRTATGSTNLHSELTIIMTPLYPVWSIYIHPDGRVVGAQKDELGVQLRKFLNQVWTKWDEVLNELDRQTTITVSFTQPRLPL